MNRVTLASAAFLAFALAVSAWLLTRSPAPRVDDLEASASPADPRAGMTFAEWSVRSDGVLLADIDPGHGGISTVPRRFMVVTVRADRTGPVNVADGPSFSWAPADRAASAGSLFALGFRVSTDGPTFAPPDDPMWSDPIAKVEAGVEQVVTLRAKSGTVAKFSRRRGDPRSGFAWNRRAIGFASSDGRFAYVTPDAVVIRIGDR
jgi:hypothetical protein